MARKPRIDPVRWQPPPVDPLPDMPTATVTVVPLPGNGPEDVVVDAAGHLWTGLEDGRIVRIATDGGDPQSSPTRADDRSVCTSLATAGS